MVFEPVLKEREDICSGIYSPLRGILEIKAALWWWETLYVSEKCLGLSSLFAIYSLGEAGQWYNTLLSLSFLIKGNNTFILHRVLQRLNKIMHTKILSGNLPTHQV